MDKNTLITIVVSGITSFLTALAFLSHKMGRYLEKIDQLERCNLNTRLSTLEGKYEQSQPLTKRKSPVSLSDRGIKVLKESGGKEFVEQNYQELKKKVETMGPKTSYDIQEDSKKIIEGLKEDERINPIKEYVFKEGLALADVVDVLSIHLRDLILKEKNINVEDIDSHIHQDSTP